jgi:4-hydroxybenzoate polyprenyltransferase
LTYQTASAQARQVKTVSDLWRGWSVTSRLEFLPDVPVHIVLPLFLVLRTQAWDFSLLRLSLIGLIVWLLAYWVGSSLNCLADYNVDRLDSGHKSRLAAAVDAAGVKPLLLINGFEALLATGLTIYLTIELRKPLLLVLWTGGLIVAVFYSFEPLRFKRRNFLNPLALDAIVYLLPFLYVYHLLSNEWNQFDLTVIVLYCMQMLSMFLADEVSDHDEDASTGVNNPCVRYGRVWASRLAMIIYSWSAVAILVLFLYQVPGRFLGKGVSVMLAVVIYAWVILEFYTLLDLSRLIEKTDDENQKHELTSKIKRFSKTPMWLMTTSLAMMLIVIIFSRLWS